MGASPQSSWVLSVQCIARLRVRVHWVAMYADARSDENNSDKSLESSFFRVYRLLLRSSGQGVGDHPNDEEYTETAE